MKLDLKNLNWSTKRRRDGSIVKYWYAWRGGPRLTGKPGSAEFVRSYNDAIASRKADRPLTGVLSFVLDKTIGGRSI
jgi:hypothetical protein